MSISFRLTGAPESEGRYALNASEGWGLTEEETGSERQVTPQASHSQEGGNVGAPACCSHHRPSRAVVFKGLHPLSPPSPHKASGQPPQRPANPLGALELVF